MSDLTGEDCHSKKLLGDEKSAFLSDVLSDLMKSIEIQDRVSFWAELRRLEVVDDEKKQEIEMNRMTTNGKQVYMLVDHIKAGTYGRYYGFCKALINDNQQHVVSQILKEDVEHIKRMK